MLNEVRRQSSTTARVSFLPNAREITVQRGESALVAANEAGLPLDAPCESSGLCGACKLRFIENAPEASPWDQLHLSSEELEEGWRLGCRARVSEDALVSVPRQPALLHVENRGYHYRLSPPSQRARVRATASGLPPEAMGILPSVVLSETPRELTLETVGDKVRGVCLGWRESDHLGVAVCVQGECLSGWLMDLRTGEQLGASSSRLIGNTTTDEAGAETVSAATRRLVRSLCSQSRRVTDHVSDIVVLGSVGAEMRDGDGRPLRGVGEGTHSLVDIASAAAVAACPPGCGATLLLSLEPYPWAMCVDADSSWLAAAPGWTSGTGVFARPGSPGAVEQISLSPELELGFSSGPPSGITLGAAVDCVAELRRAGIIDHRGGLVRRTSCPQGVLPDLQQRLPAPEDRAVFRLWGMEGNSTLVLRQEHIRLVQRLKAMLGATSESVLTHAEILPEHLDRVVLVGEEAASLRVRSAVAVGLLPSISPSIVQALAPAAGIGARLALLSSQASADIALLSSRCVRLPDAEAQGAAWAERLYLELPTQASRLDAEDRALLDFRSRGSVGIGRRA